MYLPCKIFLNIQSGKYCSCIRDWMQSDSILSVLWQRTNYCICKSHWQQMCVLHVLYWVTFWMSLAACLLRGCSLALLHVTHQPHVLHRKIQTRTSPGSSFQRSSRFFFDHRNTNVFDIYSPVAIARLSIKARSLTRNVSTGQIIVDINVFCQILPEVKKTDNIFSHSLILLLNTYTLWFKCVSISRLVDDGWHVVFVAHCCYIFSFYFRTAITSMT